MVMSGRRILGRIENGGNRAKPASLHVTCVNRSLFNWECANAISGRNNFQSLYSSCKRELRIPLSVSGPVLYCETGGGVGQ
jgi:hypothetical protein